MVGPSPRVGEPRPQGRTEVPLELVAGVVAYNEERHVGAALRSLLGQALPPPWRWKRLVVVASGCTDRTIDRAREVDPRVEVVEEPQRRGKSAALTEVFRRADGDAVILLNADAIAAPGSLERLLKAADGVAPPFAVMARPVPILDPRASFSSAAALLWDLHHRFHVLVQETGEVSNLSDEMLLLPSSGFPALPAGVVNDGGYIGAWLRREGGRLLYASDARVDIEVPRRFVEHVAQRRRIRWGLGQVRDSVGVAPSTWQRYLWGHPAVALAVLRQAVRETPRGRRALVVLAFAEIAAAVLAGWDRIRPRRDHVRWVTLPE